MKVAVIGGNIKIRLGTIILLAFVSNAVFAQERGLVKRVKAAVYEEYQVLESNRKVRDGSYLKYKGSIQLGVIVLERGSYLNNLKNGQWDFFYTISPYNVLKEKGNFVEGAKHGVWEEYYHTEPTYDSYVVMNSTELTVDIPTSGVLLTKGEYVQGNKSGIWEFYYPGGYVYQKYDYTNRTPIPVSSNEPSQQPTVKAEYVGGNSRLEHTLSNKSFENGIIKSNGTKSGSVTIDIVIDELGYANTFTVVSNTDASKLFQKKAVDLVQSIPNEWIPGHSAEVPVPSTFSIAINILYEKVLSNFSTSKISFVID